jgi:RHS repeat-associated protein
MVIGYGYDQETGLYYLQSRYYDPEIGRFINADALVSTGQSLLGNNMFAYCNNNPVRYSDPTGERFCDWLKSSLGDVCDFIVTAYEYESNSDIETAKNNLDKDGFTYYKGVPVVEADLPGVSAFSYGIIVMDPEYINNPKYDFESTLKHEYGHIVHQQIIGLPNYTTKVAIPSLICASMRKSNKFIDDNYMSLPWEHTAEILGDVNRGNYADWAGRAALIYFLWTLI